jgi:hypothetical protein
MIKKTPGRAKAGTSARVKAQGQAGRQAKKVKGSKTRINNKQGYELTMKEIDALMKKGEENFSQKELDRLRTLAEAAGYYENTHELFRVPTSM